MIDALGHTNAVFVTNAVSHAQRLAAKGIKVFLIGGELKSSTEAVIGAQAMKNLQEYHFTKGFFGANGITKAEGFTTPDANEALVKQTAIERCRNQICSCGSFEIRMHQFCDIFCFCECKDSDRWLSGRVSGAGLCDRGGSSNVPNRIRMNVKILTDNCSTGFLYNIVDMFIFYTISQTFEVWL